MRAMTRWVIASSVRGLGLGVRGDALITATLRPSAPAPPKITSDMSCSIACAASAWPSPQRWPMDSAIRLISSGVGRLGLAELLEATAGVTGATGGLL